MNSSKSVKAIAKQSVSAKIPKRQQAKRVAVKKNVCIGAKSRQREPSRKRDLFPGRNRLPLPSIANRWKGPCSLLHMSKRAVTKCLVSAPN